MTQRDIVEELARRQTVEDIVRRVCRSDMTQELKDLAQYVYYTLLTYRESCILDLYEGGAKQMEAFIACIVDRQYNVHDSKSWYFRTFRQYTRRVVSMDAPRYEQEEEGEGY
jgi:hypothetical protein